MQDTGEKEGIPPLAAAWMQRWVLLLSTYQYKIQTFLVHKIILPIACHGYQVCQKTVIMQIKFTM